MSVSVYVSGIREANETFNKMISLKVQCDKLGVSYPAELEKYFDKTEVLEEVDEDIESASRRALDVDLEYGLRIDGLTTGDVVDGYGLIVDLSKLPPDIKKLRIYKE